MLLLEPRIKAVIESVADYMGKTTTDWLVVKRQLINTLPVPLRSNFSSRHPKTKKHTLSQFDKEVMSYWETLTGVKLILDESKIHREPPEDK